MVQPVGYFKVWRELYTKPIWLKSTLEQKVILMTILAMANFKEKDWEWKGEKYSVKKGQFVTSLESIRSSTGGCVSIQNVRTALVRFEKLGFLTNESTKQGRLITIANWELYQPLEYEPNIDDNKELTKTQQRPNKELTPREEGNKEKKEKKEKSFSESEVISLWSLYPNKKGKAQAMGKIPKLIEKYGYEQMKRTVERYSKEIKYKNISVEFVKHGSTFFNGGYVDYLDENVNKEIKQHDESYDMTPTLIAMQQKGACE